MTNAETRTLGAIDGYVSGNEIMAICGAVDGIANPMLEDSEHVKVVTLYTDTPSGFTLTHWVHTLQGFDAEGIPQYGFSGEVKTYWGGHPARYDLSQLIAIAETVERTVSEALPFDL